MDRPGTCEIPCTATCNAGWGNRPRKPQVVGGARLPAERESAPETASDTWSPKANP